MSVDTTAVGPSQAPKLCLTIETRIAATISSYTISTTPIANYETHLHDLWYSFTAAAAAAAAKVTLADNPAMDRLALEGEEFGLYE